MICGAVFIPSTPMLVDVAASGAAHELRDIRESSVAALSAALAATPDRVVVLGAGVVTEMHERGWGSLRGFGVAYDVALHPADPTEQPAGRRLALSLTLGAWLLDTLGWSGERSALEIAADSDDDALDALGRSLANDDGQTLLLVVADGSAARTDKAPASLHPDAAAFDASIEEAMASGDPETLRAVDRDLAREVSAAGRPAWRVAAAATSGTTYAADLLAAAAPYGVGYLVARWHI